jgi:hypothetical protein
MRLSAISWLVDLVQFLSGVGRPAVLSFFSFGLPDRHAELSLQCVGVVTLVALAARAIDNKVNGC